jgi:hypothetical protein
LDGFPYIYIYIYGQPFSLVLVGCFGGKSFMSGCDDDDGDFYSVTLAFRQTNGNKGDGGQ